MSSFLRKLDIHIIKKKENFENSPNKAIAELIFWCSKQFFKNYKEKTISNEKGIKNISVAINLYGGIGDICANIAFIKSFVDILPKDTKLDIFSTISPDNTKSLLFGLGIDANIYKHTDFHEENYTLALICCRYPEVVKINHEAIKQKSPELYKILQQYIAFQKQHPYFFRNGTTDDFLGNAYSLLHNRKRWQQANILRLLDSDNLDIEIQIEDSANDFLAQHKLEAGKYITIQRGVGERGEATRCWSIENYNALAKLLKIKYPDYKIIQVGTEKSSQIQATDIDLRGQTTFPEIKMLLKHAFLHIDGEGGLVHLRHCLKGGTSVVIFGPTRKEFYGYDENINIQSNACNGCEWLTMDWREQCPKGYQQCHCFHTTTPETIINEIETKGL